MPAEGIVPFGDYLAAATVPDCELPHYVVRGGRVFLDEEQMRAKIESVTAAKGAPPVVYEGRVHARELGGHWGRAHLDELAVVARAEPPSRDDARRRGRTSRSPRRRSASPRRACLRPLTPSPMVQRRRRDPALRVG